MSVSDDAQKYFVECLTCAANAKVGSQALCRSCFLNRNTIATLTKQRDEFIGKLAAANAEHSTAATIGKAIVSLAFLVPLVIVMWKWALS